jgi:hypothetical protein
MTKKALVTSSVLLIAVTMVAVYLFGLHHGRTGEGLAITNEVMAAQTMAR